MSSKSQSKRASIRTCGQLLQELNNFRDITNIKIKILSSKQTEPHSPMLLKISALLSTLVSAVLGNFKFLEEVEEKFPTPTMLPWIIGGLLTSETPLLSEVVIVKTLIILASFFSSLSLFYLGRNWAIILTFSSI